MRPLRFLVLLALFIVLPTILTCISLFSSRRSNPETLNVGFDTSTGRFRALFSLSTPSSLFPPSAVISIFGDNSTAFYARPASFGPGLPAHGLSGQLWVGKGFGEDVSLSDEELKTSGYELGCSDVPGWQVDLQKKPDNSEVEGTFNADINVGIANNAEMKTSTIPSKRGITLIEDTHDSVADEDGTDDHLHHPLPDSNPASRQKVGEPAIIDKLEKGKKPTHADIESLQESADIAGKVAMLSRGGCGFLEKVKWAQRRGAIAVIVGDNEPAHPLIVMFAKGDTSNITIPAIFTTYYSARSLSSLVPAEENVKMDAEKGSAQATAAKSNKKGQNTESRPGAKTGTAKNKLGLAESSKEDGGWVHDVLSVIGLNDGSDAHSDDSRRPPGSGNIDWVLLHEWDDNQPETTSSTPSTQKTVATLPKGAKTFSTSTRKAGDDDFIIGVQDWRDTEVIAPKTTSTQTANKQKGKAEMTASQKLASTSSTYPAPTSLKGGIITPGSGEYDHQKGGVIGKDSQSVRGNSATSNKYKESAKHLSIMERIASFFHIGSNREIVHVRPGQHQSERGSTLGKAKLSDIPSDQSKEHHGLWVTLTPASPSTSPFFDTLLVLVVSPLVTLTFVYGLLLLRSRIRRRRWRAPKSIVERLPIRTYHTMSATSSTTSLSFPLPQPSSGDAPTVGLVSHPRVRPRSQTTTGVISSSAPTEKLTTKSSPQRKRYMGRQVECVVCLEEYVDGESQVMSLPCGHEFHAECITPWLVTRRRTCPICKGDVVRSMARSSSDSQNDVDYHEGDGQTSDDVQEQAAMTQNVSSSAAIPIQAIEHSSITDIERGSDVETPLLASTPRAQPASWRDLLTNSWSRLSGDTVSRSNVNDRNR